MVAFVINTDVLYSFSLLDLKLVYVSYVLASLAAWLSVKILA